MKVLVACEFSGRVRDAFLRRGHDAMSCDLLDTEVPGPHHTGPVEEILDQGWDLMIAHPPCTHLSVSGARWWDRPGKREAQRDALKFVLLLMRAPIPRIAIENPVGLINTRIRPHSQMINPYEFGVPEIKRTCLWLKSLPHLRPTHIVPEEERFSAVLAAAPGPERWKERSRTSPGIAEAMGEQWGRLSVIRA